VKDIEPTDDSIKGKQLPTTQIFLKTLGIILTWFSMVKF